MWHTNRAITYYLSAVCIVWSLSITGSAKDQLDDANLDDQADDVIAIREAIEDYLVAWHSGVGASIAEHYDEAYDWMNPIGMHLSGGEAVAQYQAASFAAQEAQGIERSLKYDINAIRLITLDVAVVDITYVQVSSRPPAPPGTSRAFAVYVRRDGRWLRAAQRNFRLLQTP